MPISGRRNRSGVQACGYEERQHRVRHEQDGDERHPANELDEQDARQPHDRQLRTPAEREQNSQGQRKDDPDQRGQQGNKDAAPEQRIDDRQAEGRRAASAG